MGYEIERRKWVWIVKWEEEEGEKEGSKGRNGGIRWREDVAKGKIYR